MERRAFGAVAVGVVAVCFCEYLAQRLGAALVNVPSGDPEKWRVALLGLITVVAEILPGFATGVFAGVRGFLLGAVTGALGSLTYGVAHTALLVQEGVIKPSWHVWPLLLSFVSIYGATLVVTCAVGGAAGELLRSNNRWSGR